jgi:hypothetical protein
VAVRSFRERRQLPRSFVGESRLSLDLSEDRFGYEVVAAIVQMAFGKGKDQSAGPEEKTGWVLVRTISQRRHDVEEWNVQLPGRVLDEVDPGFGRAAFEIGQHGQIDQRELATARVMIAFEIGENGPRRGFGVGVRLLRR